MTRFGIDGGAGVAFALGKRLAAFIEAKIQNVYTDQGAIDTRSIRVIPITFGIMFQQRVRRGPVLGSLDALTFDNNFCSLLSDVEALLSTENTAWTSEPTSSRVHWTF